MEEIFPAELGLKESGGYHVAPIDRATLLHLAIEYEEMEIALWLLDHGADVNGRAGVGAARIHGHSPLFHAVVTLGRRDGASARLLLERGADPNLRATFRKQLVDMGDPEKEQPREFINVTPTEFARQFQEPAWVSEAAVEAIAGV